MVLAFRFGGWRGIEWSKENDIVSVNEGEMEVRNEKGMRVCLDWTYT